MEITLILILILSASTWALSISNYFHINRIAQKLNLLLQVPKADTEELVYYHCPKCGYWCDDRIYNLPSTLCPNDDTPLIQEK